MFFNLFLLVLGFVLLTRGADVFVDGAVALSRRLHIPEIVIGLTVVAMGTSAPEAAVSILGNLHGASGVSVGNIIGSNIANVLLILGVAACISSLKLVRNTVRYEIPFVILITALLGFIGFRYGEISRVSAAVLLGLFVSFLAYLFMTSDSNTADEVDEHKSGFHIFVIIVAGLIALVWGSNMIIDSATVIAKYLGVPGRIIGLTVVAFGTSLPELSTCVAAAIKKKSDLVVGNIVGSNIFNILFVLGIAGMVGTIPFDYDFIGDAVIATLVALLLWLVSLRNRTMGRYTGILFVILYIAYIIHTIIM